MSEAITSLGKPMLVVATATWRSSGVGKDCSTFTNSGSWAESFSFIWDDDDSLSSTNKVSTWGLARRLTVIDSVVVGEFPAPPWPPFPPVPPVPPIPFPLELQPSTSAPTTSALRTAIVFSVGTAAIFAFFAKARIS
jgi:hypothetical protein